MGRLANSIAFVAAVFLSCAGAASAEPKPKDAAEKPKDAAEARKIIEEFVNPTPLKAELARRIDTLIAALASNSWKTREDATKELLEIGAQAETIIRKAAASPDAEVRTRVDLILTAYRASHKDRSLVLGNAVRVLAAAKDKWVVDALLKLVDKEDTDIRYACEYSLRRMTGKHFGYNAYAPQPQRAAAAKKWRAWWGGNREKFRFGAGAAAGPATAGVLSWNISTKEVFIVDFNGKKVWSRTFTKRPYAADALVNGNILISFYENSMSVLEEYTRAGKLVWSTKAMPLRGVVQEVRRLANGNTLVTEPSSRRIVEIDPTGKRVVWQYGALQSTVASAQRLANGNTLICSYTGQVIEVSKAGKTVWSHMGLSSPRDAEKLANGNILITEYGRRRVVEITGAGKEVWNWTSAPATTYPVSARRLADGRTVIRARRKGLLLVDRSGKIVKTLTGQGQQHSSSYGKVRLVPAKPQP